MMDQKELAESLRAMHRAARSHYTPAGGPQRKSVIMEEWRLHHLIHAADELDPPSEQKEAGE